MPARTEASTEKVLHGRGKRRERSRQAIVTAFLELAAAGNARPAVEEVAARAGVRPRTVGRHFAHPRDLHAEVMRRVSADVAPLLAGVRRTGDLTTRVIGLVRARALAFERIAPYKRAGNAFRATYDFVRESQAGIVRTLRQHLLAVVPELGTAPESIFAAFELVTSLEAWERLRVEQGLGQERALATVETAALALLATLEQSSKDGRA